MDVCKQPGLMASLLAVALLAAAMACNAGAPLEAYGRLPTLEDVVLSPDGQKLAFVHTAADARILAVMSIADHKVLGGARLGETKLRSIHWADNDHLLIYTSATGMPMGLIGEDREWSLLTVYTVSRRKLTPYPQNIDSLRMMTHVVSGQVMVRHLGNDTILYIPGYYIDQKTLPVLFKVNLTTGVETVARQGSEYTRGWSVDDAGNIVSETSYSERAQQWQLKILQNGHLVEALSRHAPIDTPAVLGFGPKGDSLLISEVEDGTAVWRLLSLADVTLGPPMAAQKKPRRADRGSAQPAHDRRYPARRFGQICILRQGVAESLELCGERLRRRARAAHFSLG
jgi:hypothetical protein